jgi:hypothetical protein
LAFLNAKESAEVLQNNLGAILQDIIHLKKIGIKANIG